MNSFPGSPGLPPPHTTTTTSNLSRITVFSKYIKEPSLGCPCLHKLPASLLYSGWCRFFFLLSVPARLYSPCEALCSCTAHSYSPTVHEGVLGTHSILLFNWSTPGSNRQVLSHGRTTSVKPTQLHYKLQNWSLRSQPLKKKHLKPPLDFQRQLRQPWDMRDAIPLWMIAVFSLYSSDGINEATNQNTCSNERWGRGNPNEYSIG